MLNIFLLSFNTFGLFWLNRLKISPLRVIWNSQYLHQAWFYQDILTFVFCLKFHYIVVICNNLQTKLHLLYVIYLFVEMYLSLTFTELLLVISIATCVPSASNFSTLEKPWAPCGTFSTVTMKCEWLENPITLARVRRHAPGYWYITPSNVWYDPGPLIQHVAKLFGLQPLTPSSTLQDSCWPQLWELQVMEP